MMTINKILIMRENKKSNKMRLNDVYQYKITNFVMVMVMVASSPS